MLSWCCIRSTTIANSVHFKNPGSCPITNPKRPFPDQSRKSIARNKSRQFDKAPPQPVTFEIASANLCFWNNRCFRYRVGRIKGTRWGGPQILSYRDQLLDSLQPNSVSLYKHAVLIAKVTQIQLFDKHYNVLSLRLLHWCNRCRSIPLVQKFLQNNCCGRLEPGSLGSAVDMH